MTPSRHLPWLVAVLGATCGACGSSAPSEPTAPSPAPSEATAVEEAAPPAAPPPPAPPQRVLLAGGYLTALLPSGEVASVVEPDGTADVITTVTHHVQRTQGALRIQSLDIDQRVTPSFADDVAALERRARCAAPDAAVPAEPAVPAPQGFAVAVYAPEESCGWEPPEARLYVSTPGGAVVRVELFCEADGCLPDRRAVLEAFVASFEPAEPPSSAGGERLLGPSPELGLTLVVPAGFVVRRYEGEDSVTFVAMRPAHVEGPADSLSVSVFFSPSPNTVREDYASSTERARTRRGRVAGRDMPLLELTGPSGRRSIARLELAALTMDVEVRAASDEGRTLLMRALADAVLHDPDAEDEDFEDFEDAPSEP